MGAQQSQTQDEMAFDGVVNACLGSDGSDDASVKYAAALSMLKGNWDGAREDKYLPTNLSAGDYTAANWKAMAAQLTIQMQTCKRQEEQHKRWAANSLGHAEQHAAMAEQCKVLEGQSTGMAEKYRAQGAQYLAKAAEAGAKAEADSGHMRRFRAEAKQCEALIEQCQDMAKRAAS